MDFTAFDTKKLDEYAAKAKQQWGATAAYQEYETKNAHETTQAQQENARALMAPGRGVRPHADERPG